MVLLGAPPGLAAPSEVALRPPPGFPSPLYKKGGSSDRSSSSDKGDTSKRDDIMTGLSSLTAGDLTKSGQLRTDAMSFIPLSSTWNDFGDLGGPGTFGVPYFSTIGSWPEAWPYWTDMAIPPRNKTSKVRQMRNQVAAKCPKSRVPKEARSNKSAEKLAPPSAKNDPAFINVQSLVSCQGVTKTRGKVKAPCLNTAEQSRTRMNGLDLALSKAVSESRQQRRVDLRKDESSDSEWSD